MSHLPPLRVAEWRHFHHDPKIKPEYVHYRTQSIYRKSEPSLLLFCTQLRNLLKNWYLYNSLATIKTDLLFLIYSCTSRFHAAELVITLNTPRVRWIIEVATHFLPGYRFLGRRPSPHRRLNMLIHIYCYCYGLNNSTSFNLLNAAGIVRLTETALD